MIDGKWFAFPFDEMRRLLRGIDDFVAIGYSTADDCNLTVFLARLGKDRSAAAIGVFDKVAGAGHTDLVSIGEDDLHRTGCLANDTSVATAAAFGGQAEDCQCRVFGIVVIQRTQTLRGDFVGETCRGWIAWYGSLLMSTVLFQE